MSKMDIDKLNLQNFELVSMNNQQIVLRPRSGSNIRNVAYDAFEMSQELRTTIKFMFNGTSVTITTP
jgi:hypothetical protein